MAADQLLLRSQTFLARKAWKKEYADGLRDNTLRLGRNRFTSGETVLAQADSERGALHARPDGALWFARLDGTGVSDDETREGLFAPYRAIWHYDDRNGAPETDGRSIKGDLIIWDDGTNDRFLGVCTGSGVYGLGVRAEYRTAATGTNSTTKRQPSDRVMMRGSSWDGAAAVTRDWSLRTVIDTAADGGDDWGLYFECRAGAGSWSSPLSFGRQGSFSFSGNSPCPSFNFTSGGSRGLIFGSAATQADGQEFLFKHLGSSKLARFRFAGSTDERSGVNALALSAIYGSAATNIVTTVKSAALGGTASYWDGDEAQEASWYDQLILTSADPAGYVERGYTFGSGIHRFYGDGTFATSGAVLIGATAPSALRFDAAPGVHTALDAGTGGADAWIVVDKDGSDAYVPVMDAKDLGIPTLPEPVYGELSLTDGAVTSSITDGPDAWNPITGFDTAGLAVGCVPDTGIGAITPNAGALFEVTLSVSFSGEAATEYVFAVVEVVPGDGPPTFVQVGRQARVETIDTEKHAVAVTCLLDVTTGSVLVPVVKSPTGATVGITILEGSFTIVKVAESTPS